MNGEGVQPEDVVRAAGVCLEALRPLVGRDWSIRAGAVEWSAQKTLDHIVGGLLYYASDLAAGQRAEAATLPLGSGASIEAVGSTAKVLAAMAMVTPAHARAWHPAGMADSAGFVAMGCDEALIHTHDIVTGFGEVFTPPTDLCRRVLLRLFPWAPTDVNPWTALLWANGRGTVPGHDHLSTGWRWHCAPLDEWDGKVPIEGGAAS